MPEKFYEIDPRIYIVEQRVVRSGARIIKLITAVIYGFRNKLERLYPNTRLG